MNAWRTISTSVRHSDRGGERLQLVGKGVYVRDRLSSSGRLRVRSEDDDACTLDDHYAAGCRRRCGTPVVGRFGYRRDEICAHGGGSVTMRAGDQECMPCASVWLGQTRAHIAGPGESAGSMRRRATAWRNVAVNKSMLVLAIKLLNNCKYLNALGRQRSNC